MHLALWYVVLVCHQYDVCENSVGSVYVGGYGGLSESGLCVFYHMVTQCIRDKLQIVQNTALRIATGCTHDTNTQHLHDETNVLPIHQHLQLHASQIRQKAQHPTHPLHKLTIHPHTPRLKKQHQLHHQQTHTQTQSHNNRSQQTQHKYTLA